MSLFVKKGTGTLVNRNPKEMQSYETLTEIHARRLLALMKISDSLLEETSSNMRKLLFTMVRTSSSSSRTKSTSVTILAVLEM